MSNLVETADLLKTPLHGLHASRGARMVPFAGYDMPVQFAGVKSEHLWTRTHAGLFDVSHMGPCFLTLKRSDLVGDAAHAAIASEIEKLVPSDIASLKPGQARLSVLLSESGGVLDDLIITRPEVEELQGTLYIVVNGAMKHKDWTLMEAKIGEATKLIRADDRALLALQGPEAADVLKAFFPGCEDLKFMQSQRMYWNDVRCGVSRLGYTGEDGFEVLIFAEAAEDFARQLLEDDRVAPIGLGARDSLRLEAGLCLYGNDLNEDIDPVSADLAWLIQKSRRERADFPGANRILQTLQTGPARKRVGIQPLERAPAREGTVVWKDDVAIGQITSGGFGPSVDRPVAMGYVDLAYAAPGTPIELEQRGKRRPAEIAKLPFIPPNYKR